MSEPAIGSPSLPASAAAPALLRPPGPSFLPLLLFLFLGSGCSALIYEIVWFQLLEFAVGSSATSIAVLLGTFMGGLCLGSLLFSRLVPARWHPLRVYGALELGIGILGVVITRGLPALDRFYASIAHGAGSGVGFRALIAVICLLPPTLLMGATLPAISRWIQTTPRGVAWLGFFYGGNTVGAVCGCLLAGFYLLPNMSMAAASYVAAAINLTVGIVGIIFSFAAPYVPTPAAAKGAGKSSPVTTFNNAAIYVSIGLSGMAALGAEVIWTRLLSLLLGATVYTFSIILAVFLVGLGIGSSVGAMLSRSGVNARKALALCQVLCAISIAWAAYAVTHALPYWPVDTYLAISSGYRFQLDLARCAWAVLPAALCWGASFPLAMTAIAANLPAGHDPARFVGRVYAANTVGAILGALYFSLLLPRLGAPILDRLAPWAFDRKAVSQTGEHLLITIAGISALIAIAPGFIGKTGASTLDAVGRVLGTSISTIIAIAIPSYAIFQLTDKNLDSVPWQLIAWGRDTPGKLANDNSAMVDVGEGMNSSVAVSANGTDFFFHVAGKVEASTIPADMRLQLMLGHFPSLFHPEPAKPKKVLIVGCGAGVTAGTFIVHPHEKIVICELEPLVPKMATHFSSQNNDVVTTKSDGTYLDPAVHVVFDDARHYVLTTDEKFDIITSDPIHPWVKGAASLYTQEYFESVKARLNKGGIVTQWVPLYESDMEVVKSEIATFFEVFPNGTIWTNSANGGGYDVILMGSVEPMVIDGTALQEGLDHSPLIAALLKDAQLNTADAILRTYGGRAADLKEWTELDPVKHRQIINHDANLRLQYLAGMANTNTLATEIQAAILQYRKFPADLIKVSDQERHDLETAWSGGALPNP